MRAVEIGAVSLALTLCAAADPVAASVPEMDLPKTPLFLSGIVAPNVFVTLDDSGSMESAFMPGSIGSDQSVWIDPARGTSSGVAIKRCGWQIPRYYTARFNRVYYDPDVVYSPPVRADGTPFPPSTFTAAWIDGVSANSGGLITPAHTVDLSRAYEPTVELGLPSGPAAPLSEYKPARHGPAFPDDATAVTGTCDDDTAVLKHPLATIAPDGTTLLPAFYYTYDGPYNADGTIALSQQRRAWNYTLHAVPAEQQQNFANWFSYYRTRSLTVRSSLTYGFATRVSGIRVAWQNLNNNPLVTGTSQMRDYDEAGRNAFFNWLFSFRLTAQTPTRASMHRVGRMVSEARAADSSNPFWDPLSGSELSCRPNYHLIVTDGYWNEPDPAVGAIHDRVDLPGFALPENWPLPTYPGSGIGYGPASGGAPDRIYWNEPSSGGASPTMADLAFDYWARDLRPDLPNNVPPRWSDLSSGVTTNLPPPASGAEAAMHAEAFFNPRNDPARHQHVRNYAIAFGVAGDLKWPGDYQSLRTGARAWPAITNDSSKGIDDLWHATINSRGDFFVVDDPAGLADSLGRFMEVVSERRGASSTATVSSGVATDRTLGFSCGYDTTDWSGFCEATGIDPEDGSPTTTVWRAQDALTAQAPDDRRIFTASSATGTGIPFRWADLPADYRGWLNDDPTTLPVDDDGRGADRVAFLRGERSLETAQPNGVFRTRRTLLGAVAHASTVFVAAPASGYDDAKWPAGSAEAVAATAGEGYSAFALDHKARRRLVVVGANDGMLHAFDAGFAQSPGQSDDPGTGAEVWAFVPRESARNLSQLTRPAASFEPFVDASVTVRDAFVAGAWRTILVGGLRRGGQGYFALDITQQPVDEAAATDMLLWEVSDDAAVPGAELLGYTYGAPNISRLRGGWYAILSGGYNNQEAASPPAGNGDAAVFVVDLASGDVVRTLTLPGASGAGPATMLDKESDQIDDAALLGDLGGDLWRIDLDSANPAEWSVAKVFDGDASMPITTAPRIFGDTATGQPIVLFGTGKLIEAGDASFMPPQRLYAVRLDGSGAVVPAELAQRTLDPSTIDGKIHYGIEGNAPGPDHRGWFVEFTEPGERVISTPGAHFSAGAVLVSTVIPTGGDPCRGLLRGSVYLLNASNGGAPTPEGIVPGAPQLAPLVGVQLPEVPPFGTPALVEQPGGGEASLVGVEGVVVPTPTWRRRFHEPLQ